jgi:hypothetical protein
LVLLITGLLIAVQLLIRLWTRVPGRAPTEGMSGWRMAWVRVAERLALRQMRMKAYLVKRYATLNLQEPLVDAVEPPFQGKQVPARNTPLDSTSMRPRTIQAFRSIGVSTTDQLVEWYFENHLMQGAYEEIQRVPDKDWDEAIRVVLSDVLIYGD